MGELIPGWSPRSFVQVGRPFVRRMPGDFLSLAAAQFALETGRGEAPGRGGQLWREHGNPWCIKESKDKRYQAGATPDGYAIYSSLEQAFADRLRILAMYSNWAISRGMWHGNVLGLLDAWWAPEQQYGEKLVSIVRSEKLYLIDPRPSL